MPRGYSRPEGAVPSHHRSYLFIVFEFRSASLILNPHNSNHVIRPKPKTYHHGRVVHTYVVLKYTVPVN